MQNPRHARCESLKAHELTINYVNGSMEDFGKDGDKQKEACCLTSSIPGRLVIVSLLVPLEGSAVEKVRGMCRFCQRRKRVSLQRSGFRKSHNFFYLCSLWVRDRIFRRTDSEVRFDLTDTHTHNYCNPRRVRAEVNYILYRFCIVQR